MTDTQNFVFVDYDRDARLIRIYDARGTGYREFYPWQLHLARTFAESWARAEKCDWGDN